MKLDLYLTPHIKTNSKRIKDLNIRAKTTKFLEENMKVNIHDHGLGKRFLDMTPKVYVTKGKNELHLIKI